MTGSGLQGWHVTLFVTLVIALIALVEWLLHEPPWRNWQARRQAVREQDLDSRQAKQRLHDKSMRSVLLVLLATVGLAIFVVGLIGPTLADQLAGVAGVVLSTVTLVLAGLSYIESRDLSTLLKKQLAEEKARASTDQ